MRKFLEQNRSKEKNIILSMKKDSMPSGTEMAMLVSDQATIQNMQSLQPTLNGSTNQGSYASVNLYESSVHDGLPQRAEQKYNSTQFVNVQQQLKQQKGLKINRTFIPNI